MQFLPERFERADDIRAVHASDALERARRDEDPTPPEGRRRLRDGERAKAFDGADEPEAIQEPLRIHSPRRAWQSMRRGKMLSQRSQEGICAHVARRLGTITDCPLARRLARQQRELVEELPDRETQILT